MSLRRRSSARCMNTVFELSSTRIVYQTLLGMHQIKLHAPYAFSLHVEKQSVCFNEIILLRKRGAVDVVFCKSWRLHHSELGFES